MVDGESVGQQRGFQYTYTRSRCLSINIDNEPASHDDESKSHVTSWKCQGVEASRCGCLPPNEAVFSPGLAATVKAVILGDCAGRSDSKKPRGGIAWRPWLPVRQSRCGCGLQCTRFCSVVHSSALLVSWSLAGRLAWSTERGAGSTEPSCFTRQTQQTLIAVGVG